MKHLFVISLLLSIINSNPDPIEIKGVYKGGEIVGSTVDSLYMKHTIMTEDGSSVVFLQRLYVNYRIKKGYNLGNYEIIVPALYTPHSYGVMLENNHKYSLVLLYESSYSFNGQYDYSSRFIEMNGLVYRVLNVKELH